MPQWRLSRRFLCAFHWTLWQGVHWLLVSPNGIPKSAWLSTSPAALPLEFPHVHRNQIQGQAPIGQAPFWNLILLRSEYLSRSVRPTLVPGFLVCQHHAPTHSPTYQDHPTILSLCLSSASEEHVWTRVPSEVRRRKKGHRPCGIGEGTPNHCQ